MVSRCGAGLHAARLVGSGSAVGVAQVVTDDLAVARPLALQTALLLPCEEATQTVIPCSGGFPL